MEDPEQYYVISSSLDSEKYFIGFPRIEVLPALVVASAGFLVNLNALGIGLGISLFIVIKYLRRKYGANIFVRVAYSHLTTDRIRLFYKRLPSSSIKYWRY